MIIVIWSRILHWLELEWGKLHCKQALAAGAKEPYWSDDLSIQFTPVWVWNGLITNKLHCMTAERLGKDSSKEEMWEEMNSNNHLPLAPLFWKNGPAIGRLHGCWQDSLLSSIWLSSYFTLTTLAITIKCQTDDALQVKGMNTGEDMGVSKISQRKKA